MSKIDKLYIIHNPEYVERKISLDKQLPKLNFDPSKMEWRFTYHFRDLTDEIRNKYYKVDKALHDKKKQLTCTYKGDVYLYLSNAYMSMLIEHLFIYDDIIAKNINTAMIIEDDIIFCDDFSNKLARYMNQLPSDWDVFYPAAICDIHIPQSDPNKNVYLRLDRNTRSSFFFIIRKEAVRKIRSTFLPFTLPIDFELIYQYQLHNLNVYWGEPSLAEQGSLTGLFKSTRDIETEEIERKQKCK